MPPYFFYSIQIWPVGSIHNKLDTVLQGEEPGISSSMHPSVIPKDCNPGLASLGLEVLEKMLGLGGFECCTVFALPVDEPTL